MAARPSVVAAAVFGGLAALFAYLYFGTTRLLQETTQRSSSLVASAAQLANVNANAGSSAKPQFGLATAAPTDPQLVELIEWTLNEGNTYGFDEIALSEPRAEKLRRAIEYASSVGLGGQLSLRVHVGRFCMAYGSSGAAAARGTDIAGDAVRAAWMVAERGVRAWASANARFRGHRGGRAERNQYPGRDRFSGGR